MMYVNDWPIQTIEDVFLVFPPNRIVDNSPRISRENHYAYWDMQNVDEYDYRHVLVVFEYGCTNVAVQYMFRNNRKPAADTSITLAMLIDVIMRYYEATAETLVDTKIEWK